MHGATQFRRGSRPLLDRASCLAAAIGVTFGTAILVGDIAGIGTLIAGTYPTDVLIILAGAVTTFSPLVLATAIRLLAYDHE